MHDGGGRVSCQRILPGALAPGEQVRETHHVHLDPVPRLVSDARRFVVEHAPALPAETQDVLVLLTSELVTNAVLHARTEIELGITIGDDSIVVTVHDLDLARPEQDPYASREGGWGLGLVSALAEVSAMHTDPAGGKVAWFRLARTGTSPVADGAARRAAHESDGGGTAP
jgi:anti-sigma regulatory factor (Ser/Thr protein kinase)